MKIEAALQGERAAQTDHVDVVCGRARPSSCTPVLLREWVRGAVFAGWVVRSRRGRQGRLSLPL
jgi:hypothetical protein